MALADNTAQLSFFMLKIADVKEGGFQVSGFPQKICPLKLTIP